jgi:NADH-quinone oxidoreductase subunit G
VMTTKTEIEVTIDDRTVTVGPGTTILRAASEAGLYVPHLCYHRDLSLRGSCRVCLVEVEGTPKLQPACSTPVCDGMKIRTDTPQVKQARRAVLEFLLINHPLDCPVCDKGGECKLQDYVFWYGNVQGRYGFSKRTFGREDVGPFVVRDMARCVHCTRCVRFASEISLTHDFGVFDRGDRTSIGTYLARELTNPVSGNVTELCPVGALTDRIFRFRARAWELEEVPSHCPLCSVGCPTRIQLRGGRVLRIQSRPKSSVPWICDLGRFGFTAGTGKSPEPFVREDVRQMAVPWDVAAQTVAGRIMVISKQKGPGSVGIICGSRATNEELLALRHVFGELLGSENLSFEGVPVVDAAPGGVPRPGLEEVALLDDSLKAQGRLKDLEGCDSVLFVCADPYEEAPVAGLEIVRALGLPSGGRPRMEAVGPRRPGPDALPVEWLPATPQGCAGLLASLAQELGQKAARLSTESMSGAPAVCAEKLDALRNFLVSSRKLGIIVGEEALSSPFVYVILSSLRRLRVSRAVLGGHETIQLCLFGSGNGRGALEFGLFRDLSSGSPRPKDGASRQAVNRGSAPRAGTEQGGGTLVPKSVAQMVDAIEKEEIKALFVFGCDPLAEYRGRNELEHALKKTEFLVVQSETLNETAGIAHVYLPLQSIFERRGSLTTLEGRLVGLEAQDSPYTSESLLYRLLACVSKGLGKAFHVGDTESAFAYLKKSYGWDFKENLRDLAQLDGVQLAAGASNNEGANEVRKEGGVPPQSASRASGTQPVIPGLIGITEGLFQFPEPSGFPYVLLCGRAGVSSRVWARSVSGHPGIPKSGFAEMSVADAQALGVSHGDTVEVESASGRIRVRAVVSENLMPGVLFVPFGFPEANPGMLVCLRDTVTRVSVKKADT